VEGRGSEQTQHLKPQDNFSENNAPVVDSAGEQNNCGCYSKITGFGS
jgi:hypothetical protein